MRIFVNGTGAICGGLDIGSSNCVSPQPQMDSLKRNRDRSLAATRQFDYMLSTLAQLYHAVSTGNFGKPEGKPDIDVDC